MDNRYFFGSPGTLRAIAGLEEAHALPWLKKLELYVRPGDQIKSVKFHAGRLGVFVVVANSSNQLQERIRTVYDLIRFDILSQPSIA